MPQASFIIKGEIADFTRLDNLYKALIREAGKLLSPWDIEIKVEYTEKKGDKPLA